MSEIPSIYTERKIAEGLQLPREKIRDLRVNILALKEPEETRQEGRERVWTPGAVAKLLEYLRAVGLGDNIPENLRIFSGEPPASAAAPIAQVAAPEKNGPPPDDDRFAPADPDELVTLKISHVCKNRHLMDAETAEGKKVRVWVNDNRKFVPKMELNARLRPGHDDFYELVGRGPRRKGRW